MTMYKYGYSTRYIRLMFAGKTLTALSEYFDNTQPGDSVQGKAVVEEGKKEEKIPLL